MKAVFNTITSAVLLLATLPASAISLSVVSSAIGPTVSVVINVSGLSDGAAPSLGAYDLDLGFDAGILHYNGIAFGDPLLGDQLDVYGLGSLALDTLDAGSINLFQLSFDSVADLDLFQADAFTLATLSFDAIAIGTSRLDLTINAFVDAKSDSLLNGIRIIDNSSVTTTETTNATVPEPAIWLLYGIGILVMGRLRRNRSYA